MIGKKVERLPIMPTSDPEHVFLSIESNGLFANDKLIPQKWMQDNIEIMKSKVVVSVGDAGAEAVDAAIKLMSRVPLGSWNSRVDVQCFILNMERSPTVKIQHCTWIQGSQNLKGIPNHARSIETSMASQVSPKLLSRN